MKTFIKKITLLTLLSISIIIVICLIWDPFKVFRKYEDYYSNSITDSNKEFVSYMTFKSKPDRWNINSVIIGSSRSQAFKIRDWIEILNKNNYHNINGFHFDGYAMGLYRIQNLIYYIDNNVKNLKNILLIVDNSTFKEVENPSDVLHMQPPEISNESSILFYYNVIKSSLSKDFLIDNIEYAITHKYKPRMARSLIKLKYDCHLDKNTGDVFYGYDKEIEEDSVKYYSNLVAKGIFYKRDGNKMYKSVIKKEQIKLLDNIKNLVQRKSINIKIVISPLYDNYAFNINDKKILYQMFGDSNVFDFSANKNFTGNIGNYYEVSHYRPSVAREIMKIVYTPK